MTDPVYDVDGITIYHADCKNILPLVEPADVDLLLTDPPYGVDFGSRYNSNANKWATSGAAVSGDDTPFDPTPLLKYARLILWGANCYTDRLPVSNRWLVWDKAPHEMNTFMTSDAELAWTFGVNVQGGVKRFYNRQRSGTRDTYENLHPTQKPVALMRWILDQWTEPGDLVLDPYMGSGPVARACADLGRRYIGVELVEEYVDAAIGRLGQTAMIFDD